MTMTVIGPMLAQAAPAKPHNRPVTLAECHPAARNRTTISTQGAKISVRTRAVRLRHVGTGEDEAAVSAGYWWVVFVMVMLRVVGGSAVLWTVAPPGPLPRPGASARTPGRPFPAMPSRQPD